MTVFAALSAASVAGARAACTNADIVGDWTWELTARGNDENTYTMVCEAVIGTDRKLPPTPCYQIDVLTHDAKTRLNISAPFTVTPSCVIRSEGSIKVAYDKEADGLYNWFPDKFQGWLTRDKNTFTAILFSGTKAYVKITGYRR